MTYNFVNLQYYLQKSDDAQALNLKVTTEAIIICNEKWHFSVRNGRLLKKVRYRYLFVYDTPPMGDHRTKVCLIILSKKRYGYSPIFFEI